MTATATRTKTRRPAGVSRRQRQRFTERSDQPVARVDREAGVIYGAKLVSQTSRNGRYYSQECLRDAVKLYDQVKIYLDHPQRSNLSDDRPFRSWIGIVTNPRLQSGLGEDLAIIGDLKLRKESQGFLEVLEAAENFPESFGLSHVCDGESELIGGIEHITSIREILSVDIVTEPACTEGLFESRGTSTREARLRHRIDAVAARNRILESEHRRQRRIANRRKWATIDAFNEAVKRSEAKLSGRALQETTPASAAAPSGYADKFDAAVQRATGR